MSMILIFQKKYLNIDIINDSRLKLALNIKIICLNIFI